MADTRASILLTMARLIEKQGFHATGINEIIRESGAPKGSLYYYFPGGKEQIGAEAIREAGRIISGRLRGMMDRELGPAEAIYAFMMAVAQNMEESQFGAGSPLTTAAVETAVTCDALNQASQDAFEMILAVFREQFRASGRGEAESAELAMYVTTVIEGGIVMSRTYRSVEPFRVAAGYLRACLAGKGA